jgi:nitric oxide reductase NorE protein
VHDGTGGAPRLVVNETSEPDPSATSSSFPSIWNFVAFDCTAFGMFFTVFMLERRPQAVAFDASSRLLDVRLGLLNTLVLITSSYLVALAIARARNLDLRNARRLLWGGLGIGAVFAVTKVVEYSLKLGAGITPQTDAFFGYYFGLTGIHFLHYAAGMIVLIVMLVRARQASAAEPALVRFMVSGGIFWHMVDLLWVFLFPMLYLLGRVQQ